MNTKPLKPSEVTSKKDAIFPPEMLQAVNELIIKHWNGTEAHFKQDDVMSKYLQLAHIQSEDQAKKRKWIYDHHFMDFEDIYRKEGWKVDFDKPGYNESYDANFTFTPKKKQR